MTKFVRLTALVFCAMVSMASAVSAGSDKIIIYFYSSETNINNFKSLKMEFDRYLDRFGPYEFQPFIARNLFEEHVKDKTKCLLLLSSWHYNNICERYSLEPALVGMRDGKISQKRVLVGKAGIADITTAKTGRIASASSIQHTQSVLGEIFKDQNAAHKAKILTVPKDVDALMSVGFGMSGSALTTISSLDKLKSMNPALYRDMKIIAEGKESLLLILAFPRDFAKGAAKLIDVFRNMSEDPDGKKRLKMLGLDRWHTVDPSDKSLFKE